MMTIKNFKHLIPALRLALAFVLLPALGLALLPLQAKAQLREPRTTTGKPLPKRPGTTVPLPIPKKPSAPPPATIAAQANLPQRYVFTQSAIALPGGAPTFALTNDYATATLPVTSYLTVQGGVDVRSVLANGSYGGFVRPVLALPVTQGLRAGLQAYAGYGSVPTVFQPEAGAVPMVAGSLLQVDIGGIVTVGSNARNVTVGVARTLAGPAESRHTLTLAAALPVSEHMQIISDNSVRLGAPVAFGAAPWQFALGARLNYTVFGRQIGFDGGLRAESTFGTDLNGLAAGTRVRPYGGFTFRLGK